MNELGRRIKDVMVTRKLSARELSLAAGLNTEEVARILENPKREPRLGTLSRIGDALGWRLEEMVYWALDRQAPTAPEGEPEQIIAQQLTRLHYPEARRWLIMGLLEQWREPASSTD